MVLACASREPLFCQLPGGLSKLVHFKLKHPSEPFRSLRGGGCEFRSKICLDSGLWWNFEGQVFGFFFFFSPFPLSAKVEISRFCCLSLCALGRVPPSSCFWWSAPCRVGGGCQFCGRALPPVWTGFYLWSLAPKHLSRQKLRIWAAFEIVFSVKVHLKHLLKV